MRKADKNDLALIRLLSNIRWGIGVRACPDCTSKLVSELIESRGLYQCAVCRKQFGIFNGTRWHGMRLRPDEFKKNITAVFEMMKIITLKDHSFRNGGSQLPSDQLIMLIPIRSFMRIRNIKSYSTAHRFLHKISNEVNSILDLRETSKVIDWFNEQGSLEDFIKRVLE